MAKKIRLKISNRLLKKKLKKNNASSKSSCRFINNADLVREIDYKNASFLAKFISERGKILASRTSGTSTKYQKMIAREIKKARSVALLPYCATEY